MIDLQTPSLDTFGKIDMSSTVAAYSDLQIKKLVSHNFVDFLIKIGAPESIAHKFVHYVKVNTGSYLDEEYSYAHPVIHHVDLDEVDPDIRTILKEHGFEFDRHVVLSISTRKVFDAYKEFLNSQHIEVTSSVRIPVGDSSVIFNVYETGPLICLFCQSST